MRAQARLTLSLCLAVSLAVTALAQGGRTGNDASGKKALLFLGSYFVERSAGEHAYAIQLDLWTGGSTLVGLGATGFGLQGDRRPISIDRLAGTHDDATRRLVLKHDVLDVSFTGTFEGDRLVGRLVMSGDESSETLLKSPDRLGTHAAEAPIADLDEWKRWVEKRLDLQEEGDLQRAQEAKRCEEGDGLACVALGNRSNHRGKADLAQKYWTRGCDLGEPVGCRFIGNANRYLEALKIRCTASAVPSLDRNRACSDLGDMSEKTGSLLEAKTWYRLGCNSFKFPFTCCSRLEKLKFSSEERLALKKDCDRDDYTACFILAGLVGTPTGQAEELYRKACRGVAYACK